MFYSRAVLQRTIIDSPAFLKPGLAEKIVVCVNKTRLPKKLGGLHGFCMKLIWPDGTFKKPELLASQLGEKIEKRRGWKRSIEAGRGGEDPLYT
jgi:hypothetical protein